MTKLYCDICKEEMWDNGLAGKYRFRTVRFKVGDTWFKIEGDDGKSDQDLCQDCVINEVRKQ